MIIVIWGIVLFVPWTMNTLHLETGDYKIYKIYSIVYHSRLV